MATSLLATTSAWTYVAVTYGAATVLIVGYAGWVIQRGRKVGRQLPPEERKWL